LLHSQTDSYKLIAQHNAFHDNTRHVESTSNRQLTVMMNAAQVTNFVGGWASLSLLECPLYDSLCMRIVLRYIVFGIDLVEIARIDFLKAIPIGRYSGVLFLLVWHCVPLYSSAIPSSFAADFDIFFGF
jgi:hypothetical protein